MKIQTSNEACGDLSIRAAGSGDGDGLARLAELEGVPLPEGELLVVEVQGELWAAISIENGKSLADPFRPSARVVSVARLYLSADRASMRSVVTDRLPQSAPRAEPTGRECPA